MAIAVRMMGPSAHWAAFENGGFSKEENTGRSNRRIQRPEHRFLRADGELFLFVAAVRVAEFDEQGAGL